MNNPFFQSARARLMLLVLMLAVPVFLVQGIGTWTDLQRDISTRKNEAAENVIRVQGKFATLLDSSRSVFNDLVRLNEMRTPDSCIKIFNNLRLAHERLAPDATNVGLSDAQGNVYCAVNPVLGNKNIADQAHFLRAITSMDMAIGDYALNPATGSPMLNIAYPVLSFDGKVQTVIFITLELRWLENWQQEVALPEGTVMTLVSPTKIILRRYLNGSPVSITNSVEQAKWYSLFQGEKNGLETPDLDGVIRMHMLAPLQLGNQTAAWLHLGYPVEGIYAQAQKSLAGRLSLLGLIFVFVLGVSWWGSESLFLHPLNNLMGAVERVQAGDLSARAGAVGGIGELTELAQSFDTMADALQRRESERRSTQAELEQSEARFRAMYDNVAVGMALMGLNRKIMGMNQTAMQMTGYTIDELRDTDPSQLSYPDDIQVGMEQFRDMIAGKISGFQMEKRFVRKNGEVFWGRVTYSPVPGKDGQSEYLVGIIEDVTVQRETSKKLAEQEAEYRRTLEQRVEERTHALAEANMRLTEEIEQRKRAEEALAVKAAEDAVTAERTRLARDLHDAVTQTLFAASLIAEVLPDLWAMDVAEAQRSTEELRQLTRGALAEMRTLLLELRPSALTQSKLSELVRQLCEALIGRARLPITLTVEGDRSLPPEVQIAIYRIAQESLNNVFKYAKATQVNVGLFLMPVGVRLGICDNGIGFDMSKQKTTSLGMRIMRERAEAIGADLTISSKPGEGTCIDVEWVEKPEMKLSVFKN
jgi:PAS domain S-box-containing protein